MKRIFAFGVIYLSIVVSCNNTVNKSQTESTSDKVKQEKHLTIFNFENLKGKAKFYKKSFYKAEDRFGVIFSISLDSVQSFTLNKTGNVIEILKFDSNSVFQKKITYDYDEFDNVIGVNEYTPNNRLTAKLIIINDKNGNINEAKLYGSDGRLLKMYLRNVDKYVYKDYSLSICDANSVKLGLQEFEYDTLERVASMSGFIYDPSYREFNEDYEYDVNGNIISEWHYNKIYNNVSLHDIKSTSSVHYFYKFDKFDKEGNWISQIKYEEKIPKWKILREIEYDDGI